MNEVFLNFLNQTRTWVKRTLFKYPFLIWIANLSSLRNILNFVKTKEDLSNQSKPFLEFPTHFEIMFKLLLFLSAHRCLSLSSLIDSPDKNGFVRLSLFAENFLVHNRKSLQVLFPYRVPPLRASIRIRYADTLSKHLRRTSAIEEIRINSWLREPNDPQRIRSRPRYDDSILLLSLKQRQLILLGIRDALRSRNLLIHIPHWRQAIPTHERYSGCDAHE